jgi:glycosyltransferase involved in cell wall biosynthesis
MTSTPPRVSTPTRVLYVLKRFPRLSETFILREILSLEAAGLRIMVDSLHAAEDGPRHPELAELRAEVRYLPRHPHLRTLQVAAAHLFLLVRTPIVWTRLARRSRREGRWGRFLHAGLVAARARRASADVIHAHFATVAAEVARDASALAGVPFTVTCHAKDIFHRDNVPLVAERVHGASALVTVSGYNVAYLRVQVPGVPVHLVANPVPAVPPAGWTPEGPFLCVARLVPKKGIDVLIDAMALLLARRPGVRLTIVGDGPLRQGAMLRAHERGIADRVEWLGSLPSDEVRAAIAGARASVLACRIDADGDRDGMPTVLVESMLAGVPVISTDVAGIGELVRNGQTGFLVPPDDPAALAAAMERLADEPRTADRLSRSGREFVLEVFDPPACRQRLLAVWAGAMGSAEAEAFLAEGDQGIGSVAPAFDGRGQRDVPGERQIGVDVDGLSVVAAGELQEPAHESVLNGA